MLGTSVQALEDDGDGARLAPSAEALEDDAVEAGSIASLLTLKVDDDGMVARSTVSASSTFLPCKASIASPSIPVTFPPNSGLSSSASGYSFSP